MRGDADDDGYINPGGTWMRQYSRENTRIVR